MVSIFVATSRAVGSVARAALIAVTPKADEMGVHVELEEGSDGHGLVRDVGAVLQILTNLLFNAIAFTPSGRKVRLSLRDDADQTVFTVVDEGPGVPSERAANMFTSRESMRPECAPTHRRASR